MPSYLKGKVLWYDTGQSKGGSHTSTGPSAGQDRSKSVQVDKPRSFNINMTAEQAMKQFAAMSQNDPLGFAAFQKELEASGFYGSASKVYGGWNGQTETAIADAMSQYLKVSEGAGVALSFRDFLSHQAEANTGINGRRCRRRRQRQPAEYAATRRPCQAGVVGAEGSAGRPRSQPER